MHAAENINADLTAIATQLLPAADWKLPLRPLAPEGKKWIIVFRKHKYYTHFYVELYEAEVSGTGKYKNPLVLIDPLDFIWRVDDPEVLKFLTAVARFRNSYDSDRSESDIDGLKALVNNPMRLDVYFHDPEKSPNITVRAIEPIKLKLLPMDMILKVSRADSFYELTGKLYVSEKA